MLLSTDSRDRVKHPIPTRNGQGTIDTTSPSKFRPDIEGLRAFAVLLVLFDHLASWPQGGFIGVDVFFVISGFLITGLLLSESERRGRISFKGFYQRRARRILPAAITVLTAVVIAAHLTFKGQRVKDTLTDVWWALGFSANIHFARIGTDYFQANRAPSLVQHFWSLAVEEQFYLVWPIVMVIVLSLIGHRLSKKTREISLLAVITLATVASFIWAVQQTRTNPAAAYFSTPVRAWELGVGAIAAVLLIRYPDSSKRLGVLRGPLVLVGLLGVVASAFIVSATHGFPAPGAAVPVLSTGLVILAGAGGATGMWSSPMTNPVSRYIGRISYSLYLWHWPVIVVAEALMPSKPSQFYVAVLAAAFGLAMSSYHFVETPFRGIRFKRNDVSLRFWSRGTPDSNKASVALACVSVLTIAITAYALRPAPRIPAFLVAQVNQAESLATVKPRKADPTVAIPSASLSAAITSALAETKWPNLSPSLDHLNIQSAWSQWTGCRGATEATLSGCTFGAPKASSAKTVVVLGDSFAMAWMPAIEAALVPSGWKIYGLMLEECPAADVPVNDEQKPPHFFSACDARHKWMLAETQRLNPGLVILATSADTLSRLADKSQGSQAAAGYKAGMIKTITALKPSGTRRVVTLSAPPATPSILNCDTSSSTPADCVGSVGVTSQTAAQSERIAAAQTKTSFVNTTLWFCSADNYCPSFVRNTPVRWDGGHITKAYATTLGPELLGRLNSVLHAK